MYRSGFIRLPALLVLAALVWQCGQFASFEVRRLAVKQEIKLRLKAGVPENERVNFTFSATDFEALTWVKPAREFKLKDRYYDVVAKTVDADGTVHVACIDDRQETQLFADLGEMVALVLDQRGQGSSSNAKVWFTVKHWSVDDGATAQVLPEATDVIHALFSALQLEHAFVPLAPPPEA